MEESRSERIIAVLRAIVRGRRSWKLFVHWAFGRVGHRDFRAFIILTRARSGSNLLSSYLNSHPNIRADGEIFESLQGRRHVDILRKTFARQPFYVRAKGFKLFYDHPYDGDGGALWRDLESFGGLRVIHLKRDNILHTLVSYKLAAQTNDWIRLQKHRSTQRGKSVMSVSFTPEELASGFEQTRIWQRSADERFPKTSVLTVTYEDLVADRDATFRRICAFLKVAYRPPKTYLLKQNRQTMRQTVSNYDELKSAFAATEWASFFDE